MHSTPEATPSVNFERHPFRINSDPRQRALRLIAVPGPRVLLVGRDTSWGIPLLRSLDKFRSEFSFAPPLRVTSEFVRKGTYALILIDSTVPPGQRKQLVSGLGGSDASIFYACPVENDCWWVPMLQSGQDCFGSPAFRTKEFLAELEHILRDAQEHSACPYLSSSVK